MFFKVINTENFVFTLPLLNVFVVLYNKSGPVIECFFCFYSATPSVKYGSRSNSGEVVCSFNPSGVDPQQILQRHLPVSHLTVQYANQKEALTNDYKYMFQKQADKAAGM